MIYLSPLNGLKSGYGEETFWVWFENNFKNTSFNLASKYTPNDFLLTYSVCDILNVKPATTISLCWELYPEMKKVFKDNQWDNKIQKTYKSAKNADRITVATKFAIPYYKEFGNVDVIPIGVDTDLFKPVSDKEKHNLKIKYNIPLDKEIGFWCGTMHPMKGQSLLQKYAKENPNIYWIIVWYPTKGIFYGNGLQFVLVNQKKMSELMNLCDFQLSTSLLQPYFIIDYEGMSCNLKRREISKLERDFEVGDNPRDNIFEHKWDRHTVKKIWTEYLNLK
jgi:glycosyltransferase involved in cell wall biosynthesis